MTQKQHGVNLPKEEHAERKVGISIQESESIRSTKVTTRVKRIAGDNDCLQSSSQSLSQ